MHRLVLFALLIPLGLTSQSTHALAQTMRFYVGTYTTRLGHVDGQASAVEIFDLNTSNGRIERVGESPPLTNSSHMCLSADEKHLYVSSEVVEHKGRRDGYVTVYAIDPREGSLTPKQEVSSAGPGPAYLRLDGSGRFLLLANYVGGNAVVYPIQADGLLGAPSSNEAHSGSSVNPARQEGPHPHAIVASPDNRFVYVPDLGTDRIVAYRFDPSTGKLSPAPDLDAKTPPGSGPRHFVFSPDGSRAYCSLELSSELAVYKWSDGKLSETARVSTLPAGYAEPSTTAEVRTSEDGSNVYIANRGHDSIAVFDATSLNEPPRLIQLASTSGRTPRNFGIAPGGEWVVAANQDSHSLVAFARDTSTGELTQVGEPVGCASPALVRFVGGP